MTRAPKAEPYCLLECGCLESMLGALHELGSKVQWEHSCFWHGWQNVVKILTDEEAVKIYYERKERSVRYIQSPLL